MKRVRISQRLRACAELLPACEAAADVGADRGELSYELLATGRIGRLVVSDISDRCLARARALFDGDPLAAQVEFRLGDGLSVLRPGEVQAVVVAGIGGQTVGHILREAPALNPVTLVLQPMTDLPHVRRCLAKLGYCLTDERFCHEDGHYYTVLRAEPGKMTLTEFEAVAGPVLLRRQEPLLSPWLEEQRNGVQALLSSLDGRAAATQRCEELRRELRFWEELTDDYRTGHINRTR